MLNEVWLINNGTNKLGKKKLSLIASMSAAGPASIMLSGATRKLGHWSCIGADSAHTLHGQWQYNWGQLVTYMNT